MACSLVHIYSLVHINIRDIQPHLKDVVHTDLCGMPRRSSLGKGALQTLNVLSCAAPLCDECVLHMLTVLLLIRTDLGRVAAAAKVAR